MIVAFVSYAFFPAMTLLGDNVRLNSPDETVNWTTALRIANNTGVGVYEPLNRQVENVIHPRAMTVVGDYIVPVSFLAMPMLYGAIAAVSSVYVLPFLTALISALVLPAVYGIWRRYFTERVALLATVIWAFHPALWYYTARAMYHNVLFVDLLILTWWVYLMARDREWKFDWVLAFVLMASLAVAVRLNEAVWIMPLLVVGVWAEQNAWRWKQYVVAVVTAGIFWGGWYWLQHSVYGVAGAVQYNLPSENVGWLRQMVSLLWPFGFDFATLSTTVQRYFLVLLWPLWLLVWLAAVRQWENVHTSVKDMVSPYFVITVAVTAWLVLYYGSWGVVDTVGVSGVTVGNSHVRYWLPVFMLWVPYVAIGIETVSGWFTVRHRRLVASAVLLLVVSYGFLITFFDRYEGLTAVATRLQLSRETASFVNAITPEDAIILGDRSDKVFYPDRRVISPGNMPYHTYDQVVRALPVLLDKGSVYAYAVGKMDVDITSKLGEVGIVAGQPYALPDGAWLYPLIKL